MTRLKHLAEVNPAVPAFEALAFDDSVTFHPLETVWSDQRVDRTRSRSKGEVATGFVRFQNGDILLPKTAPTFQHGRSMIAMGLANGAGAGSTELHVLRARPESDARFVTYLLRSEAFLKAGVSAYQGVAGLQRVPRDFVADWPVWGPPLEEQRRIADFLDQQVILHDQAISLRQQQADLLEERRAATFLDVLASVADFDVDGQEPASRSQDWRLLGRVLRQLTNGFVGPTRDLLVESGTRYLQSLHIKNGSIDFERRPYYVPDAWVLARPRITLGCGDLLIVQTGALGEVALVNKDFEGASCHALLIARALPDVIQPEFLYHLFRSDWGRNLLLRRKTGALHPHLEAGEIRDILIPVPPLNKQAEVVRQIAIRDCDTNQVRSLLQDSKKLLEERKRALITAAVTGEFDVSTAATRSVA